MTLDEIFDKIDNQELDEVTLVTDEGEYEISKGENFLGGREGTYECALLGHIAYTSLTSVVATAYRYITSRLHETVTEIY